MQIKIIAVGSTKWNRFIRRWGVSFLIGEDILFDTFGDSGVFLKNADRLHIDFSKIKHIIISHNDWDHISGLWYLINRYKNLTVYICPNFKSEIKERIKSFGVNIAEVKECLKIKDQIYTTGELICNSKEEVIYEQSLVIKTPNGLIIITGCAHPGIINIIENVKKQFNEDIYLVLGGLHLKDSNNEQILKVIDKLNEYKINKIAPTHCTGKKAEGLLKDKYGRNCLSLKTGQILEV